MNPSVDLTDRALEPFYIGGAISNTKYGSVEVLDSSPLVWTTSRALRHTKSRPKMRDTHVCPKGSPSFSRNSRSEQN